MVEKYADNKKYLPSDKYFFAFSSYPGDFPEVFIFTFSPELS